MRLAQPTRTRLVLLVLIVVPGLSYLLWEATRPAHDGGHGPPLAASQVSELAVGTFRIEGGRERDVARASCRAGADGAGSEPTTHFRCDLRFVNGELDSVVVHVLPNGLWFESNLT